MWTNAIFLLASIPNQKTADGFAGKIRMFTRIMARKVHYFDLSDIDPDRHTGIRGHLLWEFNPDGFDYGKGMPIVVERVVQRGNTDDWLSVFNLYGVDAVREQIKQIPYLNEVDMNFVGVVFDIPPAEMRCCTRKRSEDPHWNS